MLDFRCCRSALLSRAPHAGIAGTGAWLLGTWEVDRRSIDDMYHEGAIILLLQIICMVSTLIIYGWICDLVKYACGNKTASVGSMLATKKRKCGRQFVAPSDRQPFFDREFSLERPDGVIFRPSVFFLTGREGRMA